MTLSTMAVNEPSKISRADRATSFELASFPVPSGREEDWRFTPLRRVLPLLEEAQSYSPIVARVEAPEGVIVEQASMDDERVGSVMAPGDRPAALAWTKSSGALIVTIPADLELDEAVTVRVSSPATPSAGHIVVRSEPHSKGRVILVHEGPAHLNETVEVRAEAGSSLDVVAVQDWDREALATTSHRVSAGRDSHLTHMVITLGGDLVRTTVDSDMAEPGANVTLDGAYFVDTGQHLEHRVFIHHEAPDCYSRSAYKGTLQGKGAHSVWIGDCLIDSDADNTDTYELNRNLILTEGAKADSVPNLEIKNGDIEGAGHASATGRFDDEQLFYLMSRGVPELDAKRLVVRGFFAELIHRIGEKSLQDSLMEQIDQRLRDYGRTPDQD